MKTKPGDGTYHDKTSVPVTMDVCVGAVSKLVLHVISYRAPLGFSLSLCVASCLHFLPSVVEQHTPLSVYDA